MSHMHGMLKPVGSTGTQTLIIDEIRNDLDTNYEFPEGGNGDLSLKDIIKFNMTVLFK